MLPYKMNNSDMTVLARIMRSNQPASAIEGAMSVLAPGSVESMKELDLYYGDLAYSGDVASTLFDMCEVLRGFECPEYGNTSGRYGHTGGFLTEEDVVAVEDENYEYEFLDNNESVLRGTYAMLTTGREAEAWEFADFLNGLLDALATIEENED